MVLMNDNAGGDIYGPFDTASEAIQVMKDENLIFPCGYEVYVRIEKCPAMDAEYKSFNEE